MKSQELRYNFDLSQQTYPYTANDSMKKIKCVTDLDQTGEYSQIMIKSLKLNQRR